jgi:hypothetical protein
MDSHDSVTLERLVVEIAPE